MSKDQDKELDDFFRGKFGDPVDDTGYEDDDWNALEQMLDKHKKRRGIVYWLPVISAVAALFLLFLGWWAFQSNKTRPNKHDSQIAAHSGVKPNKPTNAGTNGAANQPTISNKQTVPPSVVYANTLGNGKTRGNAKPSFTQSVSGPRHIIATPAGSKDELLNAPPVETLTAVSAAQFNGTGSIATPSIQSFELKKPAYVPANVVKGKNAVNQNAAFHPQYALTVLAAPDLNGVGSFQQSKVGTNVGLLFSASLLKNLTISTGALYSAKPYTMAFADYQTSYHFPVNPVNVTANCQMLDIPLNIGYQLYNKQKNAISIGTGLSSYIMLHENYKFNYADPYATGPSSFNAPNSGKYFFGVLNLNATYQRQLNSKVGISVQPYLKLPLTNLGYSQVRLQTTGIAVGLNWNLNSPKR